MRDRFHRACIGSYPRGVDADNADVSPDEEPEMLADGEPGSRLPERLGDPTMRTVEERREHDKHHRPFRSWCSH